MLGGITETSPPPPCVRMGHQREQAHVLPCWGAHWALLDTTVFCTCLSSQTAVWWAVNPSGTGDTSLTPPSASPWQTCRKCPLSGQLHEAWLRADLRRQAPDLPLPSCMTSSKYPDLSSAPNFLGCKMGVKN